jgi:hypothetical protein
MTTHRFKVAVEYIYPSNGGSRTIYFIEDHTGTEGTSSKPTRLTKSFPEFRREELVSLANHLSTYCDRNENPVEYFSRLWSTGKD